MSVSSRSSPAACAASSSSSGIPGLRFGTDFRDTQSRFAPSPPNHPKRGRLWDLDPQLGSALEPWLVSNTLKERVAEHAICFRSPTEVSDAFVEGFSLDEPGGNRGLANTFDHCRKCVLREPLNEVWSARIDINHPRRDLDRSETCRHHYRVELSAYSALPPAIRCRSI